MGSVNMSAENSRKFEDHQKKFEDVVLKNLEKAFIQAPDHGISFSYGDFIRLAAQVSADFSQRGLRAGDHLALVLKNHPHNLVLYFAAALSGVIVAPIDPEKGNTEILEILERVNPRLLIVEEDRLSLRAGAMIRSPLDLKPTSAMPMEILKKLDFYRPFLVTFTSGSTGAPKGVCHSFGNLVASALAFKDAFDFNPSSIFLHNLPMSYMAGILNQFILPMSAGATVVVGPRFQVSALMKFWPFVRENQINCLWIVPALAAMLLRMDRGTEGKEYCRLAKVTFCIGTAPLNIDLKTEFENKYGSALHESYGLSETLFVATNAPKFSYQPNSVGELLAGIELRFQDDSEVFISSPWNFLGYLGETKKPEPWFVSGDFAEVKNKLLFITGRKKDLIIRGGINVSPRRIENFLAAHAKMEESVIIGVPDKILGEKIVCYYTSAQKKEMDEIKVLGRQLQESLGSDSQVDEFIHVTNLIRNLNGKIDKMAIRKFYVETQSAR